MAYLHRVGVALVAALLATLAYADVCTQYYGHFGSVASDWVTSKAAAAAGTVAAANASVSGCTSTTVYGGQTYSTCANYTLVSQDESGFQVRSCSQYCVALGASGTYYTGAYTARTGDYCVPDNPCVALAGDAPNGLTCTGTACSYWVKGVGTSSPEGTPPSPPSFCYKLADDSPTSCLVTGQLEVAWYDSAEGMWGVKSKGNTFTGATCTVGGLTPSPGTVTGSGTGTGTVTVPPLTEDHTGKCPGTVNGVEVWVTCDKTFAPGASTTTTFTVNPDGSVTTTSKTTGTTTTCTGGVCTTTSNTTTTVTVTPSGGGSGSSTSTVSGGTSTGTLSGFCSDPANATLAICDGEGKFGGTCVTSFQCTGDAVLCATAKATNEQKCLLSKESPEATLYESVKSNTSTTGIGSESYTISGASFDQTNALGVSACIPDKTITIAMSNWSKTLVLPFSVLCPYLAQLGTLLVTLSLLGAMFIVFRR